MIGVDCYSKVYKVLLMLMTIHKCKFPMYTHCHSYFYHWNCMCIAWIYQKQTCIWRFLEYVANAHGSYFLREGAPPGREAQRRWAKCKEDRRINHLATKLVELHTNRIQHSRNNRPAMKRVEFILAPRKHWPNRGKHRRKQDLAIPQWKSEWSH